jgi:serine/threonine protein kinase
MDIRVANKYRLTKKLGHGAFGDIFEGVNLKSGESVAIKLVSVLIHFNP